MRRLPIAYRTAWGVFSCTFYGRPQDELEEEEYNAAVSEVIQQMEQEEQDGQEE